VTIVEQQLYNPSHSSGALKRVQALEEKLTVDNSPEASAKAY